MRSRTVAMVLAGLFVTASAIAGPLENTCLVGSRPAASMLFPYFEVDLADPAGITTQISYSNTHDEPVLTHVVFWTDWGLPTLNFYVGLEPGEVQSLDLRRVLEGNIPRVDFDSPGCPPPLPPIPGDIEAIQAKHTGRPAPPLDLCHGSGRQGPEVATGYVTVDVVRDCSFILPGDDGYFDDGMGLATNDNFLSGEFYLIEPGEAFAQGIPAVPLVADGELFEPTDDDPSPPPTFYRSFAQGDADDRVPLSSRHRARFLHGGGFAGTTDLLVWIGGLGSGAEPKECGAGAFDDAFAIPLVDYTLRDDSGEVLNFTTDFLPPAVTFRVPIGGDEIPADPGTFGTVEINAVLLGCIVILPCPEPMQSWAASLVRASGQFSVGVEASRLDDPCR